MCKSQKLGLPNQYWPCAQTNRGNSGEKCREIKLQISHDRNTCANSVIMSENCAQMLNDAHMKRKHSCWRLMQAENKHCHFSVDCDPLLKSHVQSKHSFHHLMWAENEKVLTLEEGALAKSATATHHVFIPVFKSQSSTVYSYHKSIRYDGLQ